MKRLIGLVVSVLMSLQLWAQYDAAFTNYWALPTYYNPAASGLDAQLSISGAYSMQLVGFENAPSTMLVTADLPLFFIGPRHGVGVGFMNDKIGLFANKKLYLQYAYHQPLWGGKLSFGARVGFLNETFNGSDLDVEDSGDPAFASSQVDGMALDVDAGIRFSYKNRWYAGLSTMHATGPTIRLGDDKMNETHVGRLYYLTGGYNLKFRQPQYALYTSAIVRTDLLAWRGDITARLAYNGEKLHMYGGLSYSPTVSVAVLLGTVFHGIKIGYSYEIYTGGIGALHGSHELMVGYQTDLNLFKKGKNLHKSVRLL
ncbi:MAG: PorP/SprF family type IX secretion system membrane protein [Bacteroidaceae bacterium]|nr:PorP/SprF family type IX secretion system membrane protein [Bacteroidaceae bacterium]